MKLKFCLKYVIDTSGFFDNYFAFLLIFSSVCIFSLIHKLFFTTDPITSQQKYTQLHITIPK